VIIVGLIVLNIIPRTGKKEIPDKSLAVLPFIDDSPDKNNEHIINGIMEDLLINLQSIQDLRVPGRTSTEQYRNNLKPIPEIAAEMNVAYIVEGSGQRYGNKIRLRVQLVDGTTDRHIWAESYDEIVSKPEDIFRIQSQIAFAIAAELRAFITTEEKEIIEKIPTNSLTAYDYFNRGKEEYWNYWWFDRDIRILNRVEELYYKALYYDSSYAEVYAGLANSYWAKYYNVEYLSESFLDSAMILLDIALTFDDQLSEAYRIRGYYYYVTGYTEKAIEDHNRAIQYNPNDWIAYTNKGWIYENFDIIGSIKNRQRATLINRGSELPILLRRIGSTYFNIGFFKRGYSYVEEALKLDGDSLEYLTALASMAQNEGNYSVARDLWEKAIDLGSTSANVLFQLGNTYSFLGQHDKSMRYFERWLEQRNEREHPLYNAMHRIGYAYYKNGFKDRADSCFNKQLEYSYSVLNLGRSDVNEALANYNIAVVSAFQGDHTKAYQFLNEMVKRDIFPLGWISLTKHDPLLESIRDEEHFQNIVREMEAKYQTEHERVRRWLEENDMF
jgi:TolB-like protein/Tfp pilus assembly protein PilF